MIRAVLDTNVLASGIAGLDQASSTPGNILRRWVADEFELITSADILTELDRPLRKPYYRSRRSLPHVVRGERAISALSTLVEPRAVASGVAPHPEDDLVLSAAVSAGADYLVTSGKRFLAVGSFAGVTILSPRAFLDVRDAENP